MKIIDKRAAYVLIHSPGSPSFPVYAAPPSAFSNDADSIGFDISKCQSILHGDSDTVTLPDGYRLAFPSGRGQVDMSSFEDGAITTKGIVDVFESLPYSISPPLSAGGWYQCTIQDD